ncbi:UV excision repair protein RAD23 homolog B-like [Abrus precatorius]|uniref:UV excision repair protein RAD23 homolog B-like n=1 Tax=Abrus precatorius TaxID=3816 RepID=A0A8B8MAA6_ABRPR|nr:UV excision repair protein RAD23 homolog B-like [Abrus precatorius]
MDVTFVLEGEKTFSIEVGFYDSFQEVKEKVEKYKGIPVSKQALLFNGQLLQDHDQIIASDIHQDSPIQLLVAADSDNLPPSPTVTPLTPTPPSSPMLPPPLSPTPPPLSPLLSATSPIPLAPPSPTSSTLRPPQSPPKPPSTTVTFTVKNGEYSNAKPFCMEMDLIDTVQELKNRIARMRKCRKIKRSEMMLWSDSGEELLDHQLLRDCGISKFSTIYVRKKQLPEPEPTFPMLAAHVSGDGAKMLTVMVLPKNGTEKIPIQVNAIENTVGDLRDVLERYYRNVVPPSGAYFFTYKNCVMSETHSFNWYRVSDGDTIQIAHEYVEDDKQKKPKRKT